MKRLSLLVAGLALAAASGASAAGVNFAWDHCWSDGGVASRYFACDTSTGSERLYGSVVPGQSHPNFVGMEAVVYLISLGDLPDWWQLFNAGSCRPSSLTASADFTLDPSGTCHDPWVGMAAGGVGAYETALYPSPVPQLPSQATLKLVFALAAPVPLAPDTEYVMFRVTLGHEKTTGPGACAGCSQGACLSLARVRLVDDGGAYELVCAPAANAFITWECASVVPMTVPCYQTYLPICEPISGCSVATRNRTWGSVKALYR